MRGLDDALGDRDVLVERQHRPVDHDRGEAGLDGGEDLLVAAAVVPGGSSTGTRGAVGAGDDRVEQSVADVAEPRRGGSR